MALPWQRLFRYIILVFGDYIETNRYWQKSPYWPLIRYVSVHPCSLHAYIYTGCVGIVCKLILVHQLVLYCCLPDAASHLRPFRDSYGVQVPSRKF